MTRLHPNAGLTLIGALSLDNLVPRAYVPFGHHPAGKVLTKSRRTWAVESLNAMRTKARMRCEIGVPKILVLTKRHVGSGNEIGLPPSLKVTSAMFRRRTSHEPNRMQMGTESFVLSH